MGAGFPERSREWQGTDRDLALRRTHYHLARAAPSLRAQTSRIRGGSFCCDERTTSMGYQVYDTTLRDGAQREGITYSVVDKLAVARLLDEFGVGFIEGGWPGAMPKDTEFFDRARSELNLKHALLVAFGSTRKAGVRAAADPQVRALLDAETPAVCLVAKSDIRHVERALRTTGAENLEMVRDTVSHFIAEGRRVFLDCEHFFDGYRFAPEYPASVVAAALEAGAERVVMCDTNGGMVPSRITAAITDLMGRLGV